jgi:hypothetical protein
MSVAQLNPHHLRALKRGIQSQCTGSSTHITEAIARGLGFRTQAALLADIAERGEGRYVRFNQALFGARLTELSGAGPPMPMAVPPLEHSGRYIDGLLNDDALDFLDLSPMYARFRLTGINTIIEIELEPMAGGYFRFRRSHAIHAPGQMGPYRPSRDFDDDAAYGLHRAIESLASYYRDAVRAGHAPAAAWLV